MSRTSALAIATAAATAASLLAPIAHADTVQLESGAATWNMKASFLNYIQAPFVAGTITASEGAEKVVEGGKITNFSFPVNTAGTKLDNNGNGTIDLDGAVRVEGHHGAMDIQLSDLKLLINGTEGILQADYVRTGAMPGNETTTSTGDDKPIMTFTVPNSVATDKAGEQSFTFTPTTVTEDGEIIFESYKKGDVLDDGTVGLTLKYNEKKDDAPSGTQTPGGAKTPAPQTGSGSSTGAVVAAVVAVLAALGIGGALISGLIPGFKLPL